MSISKDKRTGRWRFDFDRRFPGHGRVRKRRLLPAGWSRAQAEAYDRKESSALSAIAEGISRPRAYIDAAVARYARERAPGIRHHKRLSEPRRLAWLRHPLHGQVLAGRYRNAAAPDRRPRPRPEPFVIFLHST